MRFKPIQGVTIRNDLSHGETKIGDIDTSYPNQNFILLHASFPLLKKMRSRMGISLFTPHDRIIESNSGDNLAPEYVMYRSRNQRISLYANISHVFNSQLAGSIGFISGLQTSGKNQIVSRAFGDPEPSFATMQYAAKPSIALILSTTIKDQQGLWLFTLQDEMKNRFQADATSLTPIGGGGASLEFNFKLDGLSYYDPRILRVNRIRQYKNWKLISGVELQDWSGYQAPKLNFTGLDGFNNSKNYEQLKTRIIAVPKLAGEFTHNNQQTTQLGLSYRPSPIKSNLNEGGNSLDPDSLIFSLGRSIPFKLLEESFQFSIGASWRKLITESILKTIGMEDGNSGNKIGSPGYKQGGDIFVLALGLDWVI
jgi:hypothetical protein